ncbi:MAG: hypothetical protein ACKPEY_10595 [Planctomycetota bacterium]
MSEADFRSPHDVTFTPVPVATHVIKLGGSLLSHPQLAVRLRQWLDVLCGDTRQTAGPCTRLVWIVGGGLLADAIRQWDQLHQLGERRCHELCLELLTTTARVAQPLIAQALGGCDSSDGGGDGGGIAARGDVRDELNGEVNAELAAGTMALPLLTIWRALWAWQRESWGAGDSRDASVRDASAPVVHGCRSAIFDVGRVLRDEPAAERAADLPSSWEVTSDTLAAWVATRVATRLGQPSGGALSLAERTATGYRADDGTQLTLLKSCAPPRPATRIAAQEAGIVDAAFGRFAASLSRVTHVQLVGDDRFDFSRTAELSGSPEACFPAAELR